MTLKLWDISDGTITHIKTLQGHKFFVYQVISITPNIIASASMDKTIKLWEVTKDQKELCTLKENFNVYSLLKLKNRAIMVSGGQGKSVSFWNLRELQKECSVPCTDCTSINGIIELPNHCIAVNGGLSSTVDIIDTKHYQLINQIECEGYIARSQHIIFCSCLHLLKNGTFIYSHEGNFCQMSATTHAVFFKYRMKGEFRGHALTISSNGKYIMADNWKSSLSLFKVDYI